ncbi:MAG: threonylcarbamoyl-AMP synthase [Sphingomonadales bacterium]|nr:threonylcarbamoyl-AMP synthase [Sphingomonadales bacterium]
MPTPNTLGNSGIFPVSDSVIAAASARLRGGGIVAVPTETVYGLAADASNAQAVAAIYRTKGRPDFNPLIVHVADRAAAAKLALLDDRANALADAFWPGPLTLVLPLVTGARVAAAVTAGLPTIALRCPAHPAMRQLLDSCGLNLAAPSANRSGGISPTRASHVARSLGEAAPMILDGGPCSAGLESTIIALRLDGWQMLRHGPVTAVDAEAVLGQPPMPVTSARIEAPGQLASHYAPSKPLRLNALNAAADEWFIGFGDIVGDDSLSLKGDLAQAAARLFDALHIADATDRARIAVAPIPQTGIGLAIHDRLNRAASG